MKFSRWLTLAVASMMLASCEVDDITVQDFLNDIQINPKDKDTEVQGYCGDGVLQPELGEECDDGNGVSGDGCDRYCWIEPGWTCDFPGRPCYQEGYCGDGIVQWQLGEECDWGYSDGDTDADVDADADADVDGDSDMDAGVGEDTGTSGEYDGGGEDTETGIDIEFICTSWCTWGVASCYFEGQYYEAGGSWMIDDYTYCHCDYNANVDCYEEYYWD